MRGYAACPALYPEVFLCLSECIKDKTIYEASPIHLQQSDNFVALMSQIFQVAGFYFSRGKLSEEFV